MALAVRRAVGPEYPVLCRMHAVELFEGGMSSGDAIHFGRAFAGAGVGLIDASGIGPRARPALRGALALVPAERAARK